MKFKSIASPKPSAGTPTIGKKIVVPNQSMSLGEILQRFTRGEPLTIGREISYHESDDDLEKISTMDLVDKEEYIEKLKQTQNDYKKQETRKAKMERERIERLAIEELKKEKSGAEPDKSKVIP